MRKELENIGTEKRYTFIAEFVREGIKKGWHGDLDETILLKNVKLKESGKILCDHIWFTKGSQWGEYDWIPGDIVEFSARVGEYYKGYQGRKAEENGELWTQKDWKLERPTRIKQISQNMKEQEKLIQEKKDSEIIQEQNINYWKDTCGGIK